MAGKSLGDSRLSYIDLRQCPQLKDRAAKWFSGKWHIPVTAYLACIDEYLRGETEYGWFLCLTGDRIVGGLGVIENDFHDRKDLTPNVCAVYTEEEHRGKGDRRTLAWHGRGRSESQGDISGLLADGSCRLLRTLWLGISVYGPGRRGSRAVENVCAQVIFCTCAASKNAA